MQASRVIFLDIDGVLNTRNHLRHQKMESGFTSNKNWCPVACKHIVLLCDYYDARVVISSSWRHEYNLEQIGEFFSSNDIPADYLVGRTPSNAPQPGGENYCRGHEVLHWINNHPGELSDYVIIDDAAGFLEEQQPHLVRVNPEAGFSDKKAVKRASDILANIQS